MPLDNRFVTCNLRIGICAKEKMSHAGRYLMRIGAIAGAALIAKQRQRARTALIAIEIGIRIGGETKIGPA